MSDATWYYADQDGHVGPLVVEDLKNTLSTMPNADEVLVWSEGFRNWRKAGEVPGLVPKKVVPPPIPRAKDLKGIAGWLVLPALGTGVSTLYAVYGLLQLLPALQNISRLPSPLAGFIALEALANVALLLLWITALIQLYRHRRSYPKLFVGLCVATLVVNLVDIYVAGEVFRVPFEPSDAKAIG